MDETLDQVNYGNSVYFKKFEKLIRKRRGNFWKMKLLFFAVEKEKRERYLERKNIFLYIKRKVKISSKTGIGISDDGLT